MPVWSTICTGFNSARDAIEETMAAPTRTPRSSWIDEGLRALAAGGPDAVRIEPLAQTLGVTKGGFYWHFEDRRALLEEILDTWERASVDEVIERVEGGGGTPGPNCGGCPRLPAQAARY
jgi:AcrR family transcriptional regulator